jgi:hypothetical protein
VSSCRSGQITSSLMQRPEPPDQPSIHRHRSGDRGFHVPQRLSVRRSSPPHSSLGGFRPRGSIGCSARSSAASSEMVRVGSAIVKWSGAVRDRNRLA